MEGLRIQELEGCGKEKTHQPELTYEERRAVADNFIQMLSVGAKDAADGMKSRAAESGEEFSRLMNK